MGETIKINMPFDKWIMVQNAFEKLNSKLPDNEKLDFEKYKYCTNYGRLIWDLNGIEIGALKTLKSPEFYTKR